MKQSDPISTTLFNITIKGFMRSTKLNDKSMIVDAIQAVAYTDDIGSSSQQQKCFTKCNQQVRDRSGEVRIGNE